MQTTIKQTEAFTMELQYEKLRFRLKLGQCEKVLVVCQTPETLRNLYIHSTGGTAFCTLSSPFNGRPAAGLVGHSSFMWWFIFGCTFDDFYFSTLH